MNKEFKTQKWVILFIPVMYFLRRILLVISCIYMFDFVYGQIAIQYAISLTMMIFISTTKPFISKRANTIEILSELAIVCILCTLLCCSDFVPEAETRNEVGKIFIGIVAAYLFMHVSILVFDIIKQVIRYFKRKCYKKKIQQINEIRAIQLKDKRNVRINLGAKTLELLPNGITEVEKKRRRPQLIKPGQSQLIVTVKSEAIGEELAHIPESSQENESDSIL